MFCRTCGNQIADGSAVCVSCGCPPLVGTKHCQSCGAEVNPEATVCIKCGIQLQRPIFGSGKVIVASSPPQEPIVMALASFFLVGLGQLIMGQTTKGIVLFVGTFVFGAILGILGFFLLFIPCCFIPLPSIIVAIDAFLIAKKLKEGKSVGEWEFF